MKLAITDACIFIDLIELQLTSEFFSLTIEIHTTLDVYNELYNEQKELLKAYQSVGKLFIHIIESEDRIKIQQENFPRSLSENDKTVIYLAEKLQALVLSSDKAVRNYSKSKAIEYHGMLWIFDKLIEAKLLSGANAILKIDKLATENIAYQNNVDLNAEIGRRKYTWRKE